MDFSKHRGALGLRPKLVALTASSALFGFVLAGGIFARYDQTRADHATSAASTVTPSSAPTAIDDPAFLQVAAAGLACAVLLAAIAGSLYGRGLSGRLRGITRHVRRVARDQDYDARLSDAGGDELGAMADALDTLLARISVRDRELVRQRDERDALLRERDALLEQKRRELRLVLEHTSEGLLLVDRTSLPSPVRSRAFDLWFGAPEPGQTFGQILGRAASGFDTAFQKLWKRLTDGLLPLPLELSQLPRALDTEDGYHYALTYHADPDDSGRFLVVVTDVSDRVAREESDAERDQLAALLERLAHDRDGLAEFVGDTDRVIEHLTLDDLSAEGAVQVLQTLRSDAEQRELLAFAQVAERIEEGCRRDDEPPSALDLQVLDDAWRRLTAHLRPILASSWLPANTNAIDAPLSRVSIRQTP